MKIKGLSHLDAEVVISLSSSYQCTTESEIAAKKSHKKRKSVGKTDGFRRIKDKILKFHRILIEFFFVTFVLR